MRNSTIICSKQFKIYEKACVVLLHYFLDICKSYKIVPKGQVKKEFCARNPSREFFGKWRKEIFKIYLTFLRLMIVYFYFKFIVSSVHDLVPDKNLEITDV